MEEAEARQELKPFLDNNPKSEVKKISLSGVDILAVVNPWGDSSLSIHLENDPEKLIKALNKLILPERLSAIYHVDSGELEVLWTAYKLGQTNKEVYGRKFTFTYDDIAHDCIFDKSSDDLITLASAISPVGPSEIGYRNILSFASFARIGNQSGHEDSNFGVPACFLIKNLEYSEDKLVEFLVSLNFYMSYYDGITPRVLIHPPQLPKGPNTADTRYRHGGFPKTVAARHLDPELLQFWGATDTVEPSRRFLYAYRIIEHAAFFFVEAAPRVAVRKALMVPHAMDDIGATADRVLAAVRSSKIDEFQRFEAVVAKAVDPEILWTFIEANVNAFSKIETFDGGFELPALVAGVQSKDDFMNMGVRNICGLSRRIRNALAHGREDKNATVILPTKGNYEKLRPWSTLMVLVAGEIILYEHA